MTNTKFDIDSFVSSMTRQVEGVIPSDVNQETIDYITNTMDSFMRMAYEAISNDKELNPTENDYILLLQILAEWIFHKSVDISRAKLPFELWDNIMQHIAFTIFEIVKQSWKREITEDVIVDAVARHVDKCYKERLKELFDNKKITKEIFEAAIAESNIDKMADEHKSENYIDNESDYEIIPDECIPNYEKIKNKNKEELKKEQERIKKAIKNDENFQTKKTNQFWELFSKHVLGNFFDIFLGFLVICLNSKINLFMLFSVSVFLFLYNHFSTSIAEFIIKCDFSLSTINFIVYFVSILIVGKIIVSSIMKAINDDVQKQLKEVENIRQNMQELVNPDKQFERLGVDILRLEVGAGLLCIADPDQDAKLLANIAALRQQLTDELGYIIPNCRIMDSAELEELEYRISVREEVVAFGYVYPNKYMVNADEWDSQVEEIPENAIVSVEPTKCAQCYWIDKEDVEKYPSIVADKPEDVIIKHLKLLVIKYVDSILTGADVKKYLITADLQEEVLMETFLKRIELEDIRRIFANLIREEVSVKDIIFVLTRLNYYSKTIKDPIELTEMLRVDLAQQITMKHADKDRNLWVVEFDEKYTKYLESNVKNTINGQIFDIPQEQINELIEKTATKLMMAHQSIGRQPVVLCSPKFRQALYSILVKYIPTVVVMSYAEVAQTVKVVTQEIV